MSTNLFVDLKKAYQSLSTGTLADRSTTQKQVLTPAPDYSSMAREVQKISDPVLFGELKNFYGLS